MPGTALHTDLGAGEYRIAIEYEGDYHRGSEQHKKDIQRWNRITDRGWILILVTSTMLTDTPGEFVDLIARKLTARGWRGQAPSTPVLHLKTENEKKPQDRIADSV